MKDLILQTLLLIILFSSLQCKSPESVINPPDQIWRIESQEDWETNMAHQTNLNIEEGRAVPTSTIAKFKSSVKTFATKEILSTRTILT